MHKSKVLLVWSVTAFSLLIMSSKPFAKENPIRPKLTTSSDVLPAAKAGAQSFECGTYKGNEAEIMWKHYHYKAQEKSLRKTGGRSTASDFIFDDVWVVEDDGTVLIQGVNRFDTDQQTFRFEPNSAGGYNISTIAFNFDTNLGSNLNLGDDTNATRNLLFTFNYYGRAFTNLHINANGIISFDADVNPSGFFDENDFFNELPKIAPYFMDLNPIVSGGVFYKVQSNKATITWNEITEFDDNNRRINSNTFQLTLYPNGSFDISFDGIGATIQANNNRPIAFGIHPGGREPNLEIISFSDDVPYVGGVGAGIFENYFDIEQPIVNDVAMMKRFYQTFPDSFFQTIFFTNFSQTMGGFANEVNIKNSIQGIGLPDFDFSEFYGSDGVLESRCNMNRLGVWPDEATTRFFPGGNNFLTIMGQEAGHRWGAFVNFIDKNGQRSNLILGRSDAHWSFFVDADHSSLEGGNWEFVSVDLFTTRTRIDFFFDIDEYIFGFRRPEEVTPTFFVSSPTNDQPQNRDNGTPLLGQTARGVAVEVTIEDIIAAEGARLPAEPDAPKDLRQAFILVVQGGATPNQVELMKLASFRRAWEDYFEVSLDGRATVNTSLTRSFPIAVIEGRILDGATDQPLPNITVRSLERGFEQFAPNGGRYTFRYMADENSGAAESVTIIADAPGHEPDTLSAEIAYGSEMAFDFRLGSNPTSVEPIVSQPPATFALHQNYPNPFNPSTTIRYDLPQASEVELAIYNLVGQRVRALLQETQPAGEHSISWDGLDDAGNAAASGLYLFRIKSGERVLTRKMLLLR